MPAIRDRAVIEAKSTVCGVGVGATLVGGIWMAAGALRQRRGSKGHHAAVRGLAFKWIRIVFCCWKDRFTDDESSLANWYAKGDRKTIDRLTKILVYIKNAHACI